MTETSHILKKSGLDFKSREKLLVSNLRNLLT